MKTAEPLTITNNAIQRIKKLSRSVPADPQAEVDLNRAITSLSEAERIDLLALYMLGRGGLRCFNKALKSARRQNDEFAAGTLVECLSLGLKRHARQSEIAQP